MSQQFEGKVVVITGAGAGLGRECALWWAREGGRIVVTDEIEQRATDVAHEIAEAGGRAVARKADVAVEADLQAAVQAAVDEWGRLDVMFANAGKAPVGFGGTPLEDVSEQDFDAVNDVVYKGVFFSGKHACRQMKRQGGGNIVVTVSAGGINAYPGFGPYNGGKAGAIGLIKSMAYDWGRYGIRVNGLAPTHGMSPCATTPPSPPSWPATTPSTCPDWSSHRATAGASHGRRSPSPSHGAWISRSSGSHVRRRARSRLHRRNSHRRTVSNGGCFLALARQLFRLSGQDGGEDTCGKSSSNAPRVIRSRTLVSESAKISCNVFWV